MCHKEAIFSSEERLGGGGGIAACPLDWKTMVTGRTVGGQGLAKVGRAGADGRAGGLGGVSRSRGLWEQQKGWPGKGCLFMRVRAVLGSVGGYGWARRECRLRVGQVRARGGRGWGHGLLQGWAGLGAPRSAEGPGCLAVATARVVLLLPLLCGVYRRHFFWLLVLLLSVIATTLTNKTVTITTTTSIAATTAASIATSATCTFTLPTLVPHPV